MVARSISDFRVLIAPGLNNSGPEHWQTRWQTLFPAFERVEQEQWDQPELEKWSARLCQVLQRSARPTLIIAHSFGCLATVHCLGSYGVSVAGALLVAPADPAKFRVSALVRDTKFACPSIMVASTNDPWMPIANAEKWASVWGSEFVNAGALGHINADSALDDWLFGLAQLQRLVRISEDGRYRKATRHAACRRG